LDKWAGQFEAVGGFAFTTSLNEESHMLRLVMALAMAATVGGMATEAAAQSRVAAGQLTCDVSAGIGLIIGSQRSVNCTFTPSTPAPIEQYAGTFTKVGIDIGATTAAMMVWLVYAPSTRGPGVLAGTYVGATAEATVAVGLGANVLVGGSNRTVALQPLSIQGQAGLNVAGGVAELSLQFVR
jgi:hypothetical protein